MFDFYLYLGEYRIAPFLQVKNLKIIENEYFAHMLFHLNCYVELKTNL